MTSVFALQTHSSNPPLSASRGRIAPGEPWSISAILAWEVAKVAQLQRIRLDFDSPELARDRRIRQSKAVPLAA